MTDFTITSRNIWYNYIKDMHLSSNNIFSFINNLNWTISVETIERLNENEPETMIDIIANYERESLNVDDWETLNNDLTSWIAETARQLKDKFECESVNTFFSFIHNDGDDTTGYIEFLVNFI